MTFRHIATYYSPGALMPETETKTLDRRDVELAKAEAPSYAYCFTMHDVAAEPPAVDERYWRLLPIAVNESDGRWYLGGEVFTLAELRGGTALADLGLNARDDAERIACNVEGMGATRAIRCSTGNWQPFTEHDVLLPEGSST